MGLWRTFSRFMDQVGEKFDDLLGIGGLDTFELVQSIENEFEVVLADSDLEEMSTVGDLHAWLTERTVISRDGVWDRITPHVADFFGVSQDELSPETTWKELGA